MHKHLLILFLLIASIKGYNQNYNLDKNHSRLSFTAKHFGISHVEGNFKIFEVTFKSEKTDFTDATIHMKAATRSIDTDVEMRDKDLRGDNWLDAEKFPELEFKSTSFKKSDEKNYKLAGNITIHGVTKPIVFDVTYNGKAANPMSKKSSIGFTVTGKINRKDFGVGTDAFESVVGKEVELRSDVEFIID